MKRLLIAVAFLSLMGCQKKEVKSEDSKLQVSDEVRKNYNNYKMELYYVEADVKNHLVSKESYKFKNAMVGEYYLDSLGKEISITPIFMKDSIFPQPKDSAIYNQYKIDLRAVQEHSKTRTVISVSYSAVNAFNVRIEGTHYIEYGKDGEIAAKGDL